MKCGMILRIVKQIKIHPNDFVQHSLVHLAVKDPKREL